LTGSVLRTPHYKESIELLKGYKSAMDILGTPITPGKINKKDQFNQFNTNDLKATDTHQKTSNGININCFYGI
jgi:hypothetical protein